MNGYETGWSIQGGSVTQEMGSQSAVPKQVVYLVEVGENQGVLVGEIPEELPSRLILRSDQGEEQSVKLGSRAELIDQISCGIAGSNSVLQAGTGLVQAQGLVTLAPETLQALHTAQPLTQGGWNLGTLVGGSGKFTATIRWLPATSAGLLQVASVLGPAGVMFALAAQLASVSGRLNKSIELISDVLAEVQAQEVDKAISTAKGVNDCLQSAQHTSGITEFRFKEITHHHGAIRDARETLSRWLKGHVAKLQNHTQRNEYLTNAAAQIKRDAQVAALMVDTLRVWWQLKLELGASQGVADLENHADVAWREIKNHWLEVTQQLDEIERLCRLYSALHMRDRGKTKQGKARQAAKEIVEVIEALRGYSVESSPPEVVVLKQEDESLVQIASLALPGVRLVADVNVAGGLIGNLFGMGNHYLLMTETDFYLTPHNDLEKSGLIGQPRSRADVRYVRYDQQEPKPVIQLVMRSEDLRLTFDAWGREGDGRAKVCIVADALGSTMNLPATEIPANPLPGRTVDREHILVPAAATPALGKESA